MTWQAHESFYNAPASLYCLAAISHRPPKGGMLKGVGSLNLKMLKRGAINATWDICLLERFGGYVTSPNSPSWSLWSDDYALKIIAKKLFVSAESTEHEQLVSFYTSTWGKDGAALVRHYLRMAEEVQLGSEERNRQTHAAFRRVEEDITALEKRLGLS